MGREELAAALKQKGEAEANTIRQQAEAEAEHYRQQRWREVEQRGKTCDREVDWSARQECRQVDWRVAKQLRNLRLQALQKLDRRLWQQLQSAIARFSPAIRQHLLESLATELPNHGWEIVTVHPDDAEYAGRLFPDCQVQTDSALGAGLIVEAENGDIRVDNSLSRRLQKQWPGLCSELLAGLEEQAEGDAG